MALYLIANGAMQTTAAFVKVATGAAIKTMLQVKPITPVRIIEWGCSFDGSAAATPGEVELIETGAVAATVTANAAADITQLDPEAQALNAPADYFTLSTSGTGFTATVEGTPTTVRNLDAPQLIAPTNQFIKQFPLGREPYIQPANIMRIRMTFAATVNAYCYVILSV